MKFKFLFLLLSIFLASFASAVVSYAEWPDYSGSLTIDDGESTSFEVIILSMKAPVDYSVKLYDNSYNLIHTFESGKFSTNSYNGIFNLDKSIYGDSGNYRVVVLATDSLGSNTYEISLTVNYVDTVSPVITLLGENPQEIVIGNSYTELGATATDNVDGDLTSQIQIDSSGVNVNLIGSYLVYYNVSDSAGNLATTTRTVDVVEEDEIVDIEPPVITILGENPLEIYQHSFYIDSGAIAIDNVDGDLTSEIVVESFVNTSLIGTYNVSYYVEDSSGNYDLKHRTVNVIAAPSNIPIIILNGMAEINVSYNSTYNDPGASAHDPEDGDLSSEIVVYNPVNTSILGTYYITYNVNDSDGNAAVEKVRVVHVINDTKNETEDLDAPIITVISPKDGSFYSSRLITFKININEEAEVWYVLNGGENKSMKNIHGFVFENTESLSYGNHEVIFYAIDEAGNVGQKSVEFSVKRSRSKKTDDIEPVNYFDVQDKNDTSAEVFVGGVESKSEFKPGYLFLLVLGVGILIVLILITLIMRDNNIEIVDKKSDEMIEKTQEALY